MLCSECQLVFVPGEFHLSEQQERAEYDLHQNSPSDVNYRRFLSRLLIPLSLRLSPPASGLDFGCGPGPTLSVMLEEAGHFMSVYDKFYADDESVLRQKYGFITCTETIEHLHDPAHVFDKLMSLLEPGAYLGIMTKLVTSQDAFLKWHYKNDLTHICFYSQSTCRWIANRYGCDLEFPDKDVILFRKGH